MLTKLEHVEDIAHENKLHIHNFHFSNTKKAACMKSGDYKAIALDRSAIETTAEECVLLAEEVGHYETGALYSIESTYNTPVARSNRIKFEAKAKHWAIDKLLSPDEIECGLKMHGGNITMVAEHYQVTVDFLQDAIDYFRSCGIVFQFDEPNEDGEHGVDIIQLDVQDDGHNSEVVVDGYIDNAEAPQTQAEAVTTPDIINKSNETSTLETMTPVDIPPGEDLDEFFLYQAIREGARPRRRSFNDKEWDFLFCKKSKLSFERRLQMITDNIKLESYMSPRKYLKTLEV